MGLPLAVEFGKQRMVIGFDINARRVTKLQGGQDQTLECSPEELAQAKHLRYFNVFGPRQDPNGAYAAVIPKWTEALLKGEPVFINGDGETSRDFCFVSNAVQANLLAACAADEAKGQAYSVAVGERTTLNQLFAALRDALQNDGVSPDTQPIYRDFRAGDVRHSQADIGKAQRLLGFVPTRRIQDGIGVAMPWYVANR